MRCIHTCVTKLALLALAQHEGRKNESGTACELLSLSSDRRWNERGGKILLAFPFLPLLPSLPGLSSSSPSPLLLNRIFNKNWDCGWKWNHCWIWVSEQEGSKSWIGFERAWNKLHTFHITGSLTPSRGVLAAFQIRRSDGSKFMKSRYHNRERRRRKVGVLVRMGLE